MNYLVTGGAGFIGSHLCEALLKRDDKVICLDNFDDYYSKTIKIENVNHLKENARFQLITGDICDIDNTIDLLESKKIDMVIHLAGRSGVGRSVKNPIDFITVNTKGTAAILEAIKEVDIKKIVHISTSSVYGQKEYAPYFETSELGQPYSVYAATKQSAEHFVKMYHHLYGIDAVVLRLFSVFGPKQPPESGIYQFVKANLNQTNLSLYGGGNIERDYTYIDDIIDGIISSIDFLKNSNKSVFEIFNLGSGQSDSINDVLEVIESITNKKTHTIEKNIRKDNLFPSFANIDKATKLLNYSPKVPFSLGIKKTIDWIESLEIK
ncbi:MAG: SDR family NAD(P)-dependent oxidoreductase [Cytophagales bacterium]|nr:MAG: SDR family NAD(P)-dependent oxidoreductase [Cytophagales bacterium]